MTDQRLQDEDVLELDEDDILDDEADADDDQQDADAADEDDGGDAHEPDDFVGFADDEQDAAPAENDLVRHLRQQLRDRDKKLADAQRIAPPEKEIVVGPKPTMDSCDWDADRYEQERDAWDGRVSAAAKQAQKREQAQADQAQAWEKVTEDYRTKKAALRYPDVQQAEQVALDTLSPTAQALIAKHADNSALFMYAVGKSPAKLALLARVDAEGDPFAVVKAVTKMEATLTTKRSGTRPPDPERPVRGKPMTGSSDKALAKLEAEADKTGNYSKIVAYKAAQKGKK